MSGTGNKSLTCTATGFFLSQHRWSILHFLFMLTWCFEKRLSICVNTQTLHTQVCWFVNFSVSSLPVHKVVLNSWTFSAPNIIMHIFSWLQCYWIIFRVFTFCWFWPVFSRQLLKIKNTRWRFLSKDKLMHYYTITARQKRWTVDCMNSAFTPKPVTSIQS